MDKMARLQRTPAVLIVNPAEEDHHMLWRSDGGGPLKRFREAAGFALLIAGLLGLLLPVMPGTPLLIAGVALLGPSHPRVRRWMKRFEHWRGLLRRKKT